jgi:hypothetical protein
MNTRDFIICIFFLLLSGGQSFYANTTTNNNLAISNSSQDKTIKQVCSNSFFSFIENTDIDCEEEFSTNEENKDEIKYYSSNTSFYSKISFLYSSNFCNHYHLKTPFTIIYNCNNSPIYLFQGVLRI